MALNERQILFVDEHIKLHCRSATQAGINAGYSRKSAHAHVHKLLKNAEIQTLIAERKNQLRQRLQEEFIFDALCARETMNRILKDENASDRDKITVARDFLDRAGFKASDKVELSGAIATNPFAGLTTEELRRLAGVP